jgi:predicted Zn-dependent protease
MFALLLAMAVPVDPALEELVALDVRVASVGDRLARSGGCDGVLSGPGWVLQDIAQYDPKLRRSARNTLQLGDRPTVVAMLPGSAAAKAGLRVGDQIETVGTQAVSPTVQRGSAYQRLGRVEDWIEDGLRSGEVTVRVRRSGFSNPVRLAAEPGCPSRFQMQPGRQINAEADGRYVQVTGALVELTRNDDELALVLAHELAHNILGHRVRLKSSGVSRGLFAGFRKSGKLTRQAELEADRMAFTLMARAGYDVRVAPEFWKRMERKSGPSFLSDGTHPSWRERIRLAEQSIAEVRPE